MTVVLGHFIEWAKKVAYGSQGESDRFAGRTCDSFRERNPSG